MHSSIADDRNEQMITRGVIAMLGPKFHQPAWVEYDPTLIRASFFKDCNPLVFGRESDGPFTSIANRPGSSPQRLTFGTVAIEGDGTAFGVARITSCASFSLDAFVEYFRLPIDARKSADMGSVVSGEVDRIDEMLDSVASNPWLVIVDEHLDAVAVCFEDDVVLYVRRRLAWPRDLNPHAIDDAFARISEDDLLRDIGIHESRFRAVVDQEPTLELLNRGANNRGDMQQLWLRLRGLRLSMDEADYKKAVAMVSQHWSELTR